MCHCSAARKQTSTCGRDPRIYQGLITILKRGGHEKLPELLECQSESHRKALEELAEAQYQSRILYYALCMMESDHALTPDEAITEAERWSYRL